MAGQGGLAEQVRVGLATPQHQPRLSLVEPKRNELEELWFGRPVRVHVWEFCCVLGTGALIIAAVKLWRGNTLEVPFALTLLALALVALGKGAPRLMLPVWRAFIKLGHVMGLVMTSVLLFGMWLLVFIPMGLGLRIFGKQLMNSEFRANLATYWEERDPRLDDFQLLKKQF
ncbi:MAG: hypothetical protein K1X83_02890 [Oligoflexia bacterium]|nr:hypothetical protein [Oligoflexia bacterium]